MTELMNGLITDLKTGYPHIYLIIDRFSNGGMWITASIKTIPSGVDIEYRPRYGFGVSVSTWEDSFQGHDEVFTDFEEAKAVFLQKIREVFGDTPPSP